MALQLQLTYSTSNDGSDCGNIVIDESTGEYNATTNTGGFEDEAGTLGSGNPKRSEVAIYQLLTKKNPEATDLDVPYTNVDADAITVTSWTIPVSTDGWYRAQSLAIPVWDDTASYASGQLVWFSDALYRANETTTPNQSPASVQGKWDAFESTEENIRAAYDNPAGGVGGHGPSVALVSNYLDFLQHCYGDETYADAWKDVSDDRPSFYSVDAATAITALLEGAKIAAARENYQEADRKILIVQDLSNNINCKRC